MSSVPGDEAKCFGTVNRRELSCVPFFLLSSPFLQVYGHALPARGSPLGRNIYMYIDTCINQVYIRDDFRVQGR